MNLFRSESASKSYYYLLCVAAIFLASCSSGHIPEDTYLSGNSMSGIENIAVTVSMRKPEVHFSTGDLSNTTAILSGLIGLMIEESINSERDKNDSAEIRRNFELEKYEDRVANSFIETLKECQCYRLISHIAEKDQEPNDLLLKNYDALVELDVDRIILERDGESKARIGVYVKVSMVNLTSGEVLLDREEYVPGMRSQTMDYYKQNGMNELGLLLDKAGRKVAYDFLYLK